MDSTAPGSPSSPEVKHEASTKRQAWFARWPELPYLLPLVIFWIGTFCEPKAPAAPPAPAAVAPHRDGTPRPDRAIDRIDGVDESAVPAEADAAEGQGWIAYRHYPLVYSIKIALVATAIAFCWPAYRPVRFPRAGIALAVGVGGAAIWIGLVELGVEKRILEPLGLQWLLGLGPRSGFNPLEQLQENWAWAYLFLAIRFFGLALVVPIMEEFFLRGFLMRFVMHPNWTQIPIGQVSPLAIAAGTLVPMLMHPSELLAAAVWFSLVTWLLVRSRSVWTCVLAHAATNLVLGLYVLATGHWYFM